jgi:hypothetical protein
MPAHPIEIQLNISKDFGTRIPLCLKKHLSPYSAMAAGKAL